MRRKRRKVIVRVTETWTFFFDEVGEMSALPLGPPVTASIPTLSPDTASPIADAPDAPSDEKQAGDGAAEKDE